MSKFNFILITALIFTFFLSSSNVNAINFDIVNNPTSNIKSSTGYFKSVTDFVIAFNNARQLDNTVSKNKKSLMLTAYFDLLSKKDQIQVILDSERDARGLTLNYTNHPRLNSISQAYAQALNNTGQFTHTLNNTTPWTRMDSDVSIKNCREFHKYGESLFRGWSTGKSTILWHLYSIYGFIYDDAGSNWGHRMHLLSNYNNNHFTPDNKEGYIGIGILETTTGDKKMVHVVINSFDPKPSCRI